MIRRFCDIAAGRLAWAPPEGFPPRPTLASKTLCNAPELRPTAEAILGLLEALQTPTGTPGRKEALTALSGLRRAISPASWAMIDMRIGRGMSAPEISDYAGIDRLTVAGRFERAVREAQNFFHERSK